MDMKKVIKFIVRKIFWGGLRHFMSDKWYIRTRYWLEVDGGLNLDNPQKFTEKIQHIKLYDRIEIRQVVANRTTARTYVSQKVGSEYLVPLIGVYEELTRKIWGSLPQQFVLKGNHGCGMLKIVFDKSEESYNEVYQQTENWKKIDYADLSREWAYEEAPRTILAEKLLLTKEEDIPKDYKFFCFHGHVEIIQIDFDRFGNQKRNLYNRNFDQLDAKLLYPNYTGNVQEPPNLEEAINIAEILASEFNFVRVDLYLLKDTIYFGELTNYPGNGFVPFEPEKKEYEIGSLLEL